MSAVDLAIPRLQTEEGFRASVYKDSRGFQTIGYGFRIGAGITQRAATALLAEQIQECHEQLSRYVWYASCNPVRQSVLIDLAFNDGISGLLGYINMIAAISKANWPEARVQLLDSEAAREDPNRYGPLAQLLLTGAA
jgi:lysozyme